MTNSQIEMRLFRLTDKFSDIKSSMRTLETKLDTFSHDLAIVQAELKNMKKVLAEMSHEL